jgi:enolase
MEAIEMAGHKGKVDLGMDVAASEFWVPEKKMYDLDFKTANNDGSKCLNGEKLG